MFGKIFGKPKEQPSVRQSLDKLSETREMLEKKLKVLEKRVAMELQKAQEFSKQKNKRAAIQCLKKKKLYENQIDALNNYIFRLQDQEVNLEGASVTVEMMSAMKESAQAIQGVQKKMNIDDVDKTLDEINEQSENMKQIQDALSQPVGIAADLDEDELMAELEELEALELDEQLLQPAAAVPAQPLPSVPKKVPAQKAPAEEEDELERMRAEMAM
ncbi:hypothetical protein CLOM_g1489 [Closterium sp. NIES-68]|nr:hypothetical protein CLOM_g1489 [Closterium sp. NIES-68]GJP59397.1 hypothetical protein CLOP_g11764 [Closterium sp. NIES-67]GJP61774.1 hypothetical protein CLOP_g18908 [Closterium sp. NIES-67]